MLSRGLDNLSGGVVDVVLVSDGGHGSRGGLGHVLLVGLHGRLLNGGGLVLNLVTVVTLVLLRGVLAQLLSGGKDLV